MIILDDNENISGIEPVENNEENNENKEMEVALEDTHEQEKEEAAEEVLIVKEEYSNNIENGNIESDNIDNNSIDNNNNVMEKVSNNVLNSNTNYYSTMASTFPDWELLPPGVPIKRVRRK